MNNRIDSIFTTLRTEKRKALMPFITAGYPSLEATEAILRELDNAGCSVCEIGIPFSDPIADGPVISASMTEALNNGVSLSETFECIKRIRPEISMGLIAMVSYSIVYRYGLENFVKMAHEAGFDGFIFPDITLVDASEVNEVVDQYGMSHSLLIAPSTPLDRATQIAQCCRGFVYILARAGITGVRAELPTDLVDRLKSLSEVTDLPLAVGFGISKALHVNQVTSTADAAIVGSAIVKHITEHKTHTPQRVGREVGALARELMTGLQ